MNKNKRKLNKLAIVNKGKGQRVASEGYYLSAKSMREGMSSVLALVIILQLLEAMSCL